MQVEASQQLPVTDLIRL